MLKRRTSKFLFVGESPFFQWWMKKKLTNLLNLEKICEVASRLKIRLSTSMPTGNNTMKEKKNQL